MQDDFESTKIAINLASYRCPRYDDFPNFGLYAKQVIEFLDKHLSIFLVPTEEKLLTTTMINNYVKIGIVKKAIPLLKKLGFIDYKVVKEMDKVSGGFKTVYILLSVDNYIDWTGGN